MRPPAVIVHGLDQARRALAEGRAVTLMSAPSAGAYAGVGWWRAVMAACGTAWPDILDCGSAGGRAMEALRGGQKLLVLRAPASVLAEVRVMAGRCGAEVLEAAPAGLDLGVRGAERRLTAWLGGIAAEANAGIIGGVRQDGAGVTKEGPFMSGSSGPTHHIAAQFEDLVGARAAHEALVAAGVPERRIMTLDRGHAAIPAERSEGLWGSLKGKFVPDRHAHPYAEGVARGHPLVMADVTEAELAAATAALTGAGPINIEDRANEWAGEGWDGVHAGQGYWLGAQADRDAASSGGITAGGIMSGDYGSVGGLRGLGRADTDITRGMGSRRPPVADEEAVVVRDDPVVRVYQVG